MSAQVLGIFLVTLLILIVLFLIFREFLCWYWKVNETLAVMLRIESSLDTISQRLAPTGTAAAVELAASVKKCSNCGKDMPAGDKYCDSCGARS
jgi:hypothetical protein